MAQRLLSHRQAVRLLQPVETKLKQTKEYRYEKLDQGSGGIRFAGECRHGAFSYAGYHDRHPE